MLDLSTAFDGMDDLDTSEPVFHPVNGRVLHIDADFLAYMCSAQSKDPADQKTFSEMQDNARTTVDNLIGAARASDVFMHLTHSESNKGGRYGIALQRQYQASRDDKPKPLYLNEMRKWLCTEYPGAMYLEYEADDGMSSAQHLTKDKNLSVICSKDKDLLMVPGLHLDWDTGELWNADEVGHVEIRKTNSGTSTLKGQGFAFFAGQLLTGDTADTITGLPRLAPEVANKYAPKAKGEHVTPCLVGPVTACKVLEGCTSIRDYWYRVGECYKAWGSGFSNYMTGEPVSWQSALLSESGLLWMRRYDPLDRHDLVRYLKEHMN